MSCKMSCIISDSAGIADRVDYLILTASVDSVVSSYRNVVKECITVFVFYFKAIYHLLFLGKHSGTMCRYMLQSTR